MPHQMTEKDISKVRRNCRVLLTITLYSCLPAILLSPSVLTPFELFGQGLTEEEEAGVKAARQVINAFNTGNVSNVSDFISDQYFNRESQIDQVRGQLRGPTEFIDTVEKNRMGFPDLHHQELAIIAQDDIVVSILNVTGTQTGNFFILPPTGNEISYEAAHVYRIGDDGKIVEHNAIRDDLSFLTQLEIVEPSSPEYVPFFEVLTGTGNRTG
jgi:predicted ester cyclase